MSMNAPRVLRMARLIYPDAKWSEYSDGNVVSKDYVWFDPVNSVDDFNIVLIWYMANRKNYEIDEDDMTIVSDFIARHNKTKLEYMNYTYDSNKNDVDGD